jgi:hypothetical protein
MKPNRDKMHGEEEREIGRNPLLSAARRRRHGLRVRRFSNDHRAAFLEPEADAQLTGAVVAASHRPFVAAPSNVQTSPATVSGLPLEDR